MHSSYEFRSVKAKVRVLCKQRRIRLEEFMKTFDVHHVKKIKVDQFKRALDVSGLQLTSDEMTVIVGKYRIPHEPSFVDYRRFCDLIDKIFTVKGLEAKPDLRSSITSEITPSRQSTLAMLTPSEERDLCSAKDKLSVAVRAKGIVLKDVFHDFDRSNAGKVTKTQFVRDLLDIVVLSAAEVNAMVKAYGNDLDVNYRALHRDITPGPADLNNEPSSPGSWSPDRPRRFTAPASTSSEQDAVARVIGELSELAIRDRIRTKNYFIDFDPLRTGSCTETQFKRCVKLCFSNVTEAGLALLATRFTIKDLASNKVDYIAFCNSVEGKNNGINFGASVDQPDDILSSITAATLAGGSQPRCSREMRGSLSDSELEIYQQVMQRLSTFCGQRRMLIKPSFQDFDKGHREHITTEQFFRVMTMLKLTLNSDAERRVILKRYASAHGDRFVNYVTFCRDIELWEENNNRPPSVGNGICAEVASEILSPTRIEANTFETIASAVPVRSVPMLMRYIKQTVKRDRVRLEEYYRDFDKLRHGKITTAQFAAGLNAAGLLLTKEEMKQLGAQYALTENDSTHQPFIAWKKFVDDVESVFTVKNLERMPNHDLAELQTKGEQFGGSKVDKDLTTDEELQVTQAVVTMKKAMDRQRLEIKAAFEDFDRSKQGFISATKFDRVLSVFKLLPGAAIARLLVIKFREQTRIGNSTTLSSICDVNYRAFLQALEIVGQAMALEEDATALILPGCVAYRQGVYSGGHATLDNLRRQTRDDQVALADVSQVLKELRRQLSAKRIRIKEFIVEGDKLRSGEITIAKFHTALNRSGCIVDAIDVTTLTKHFGSTKNSDKIDWRQFLEALERPEEDNDSNPISWDPDPQNDDYTEAITDSKVVAILTKLRQEVNNRRLHMKPYFQDYDHNRMCRVTKFQFAAVLDMMKLTLKPSETEALQLQFMVRTVAGRKLTTDVNYLAFIHAVDSEYS